MTQPSWLPDTLAAVMIITAGYCVGRLAISHRQHRPTDHQVDAVHVLMGVAMAGMLVPRLRVFWTGGWEIVFGAAAAWFAWHALGGLRSRDGAGHRERHHLQHALAGGAMVYMLLAPATRPAASGPAAGRMAAGAAHFPTLALILAVALLGYVVWTADQLPSLAPVAAAAAAVPPAALLASGRQAASAGQGRPQAAKGAPARPRRPAPVSPRLAAGCEIAMGVTMGYMLIMMV